MFENTDNTLTGQVFDPNVLEQDVEKILDLKPLNMIDRNLFRSGKSLSDIITAHSCITHYSRGDIIVLQGDYGSSAFFIMKGKVRVIIGGESSDSILGRGKATRKSLWQALSQSWANHKIPEFRHVGFITGKIKNREAGSSGRVRGYLADVDEILQQQKTAQLVEGQFFGENAALSRSPRNATIFSESDSVLLEIRWQGLRDILRRDKNLREFMYRLYKDRTLATHIRENSLFSHLNDEAIDEVVEQTEFLSFGESGEIIGSTSELNENAENRLDHEPLIACEGDYVNGIYLIRSGSARLSCQVNYGHRTRNCLGPDQAFGLKEIVHNYVSGECLPFQNSIRALGVTEVFFVPVDIVEKYVLPNLQQPLKRLDSAKTGTELQMEADKQNLVEQGFLEFVINERFQNGTATMLINLDRCVGCDECVKACATTHDNNPRFIRHGKQFENIVVTNACMHCRDPVCMIGCPTGAIFRSTQGGQVVINDQTCIGCGTCASNCPYDNIRMTTIRDANGELRVSAKTSEPLVQATKCDLCANQRIGPACVNACPHDAMIRADVGDLKKIANWVK